VLILVTNKYTFNFLRAMVAFGFIEYSGYNT